MSSRAGLSLARTVSNQLGDLHPGAYSDYTGYTSANRVGLLSDPNRWQPLVVSGVLTRPGSCHIGVKSSVRACIWVPILDPRCFPGVSMFPTAAYWKQALQVIEMNAQLGDMEKMIAEYWADGPTTVTPPGHWNVVRSLYPAEQAQPRPGRRTLFCLGECFNGCKHRHLEHQALF